MPGLETAALPASLRRTNQRRLVSLLQRLGSASKADLAKAAGVSQPTVGKIISELARLGILEESGTSGDRTSTARAKKPRLGRPGQLVRLNRHDARFLAIELGVEETSVAALPVDAPRKDEWAFSFSTPASPGAWVRQLRHVTERMPQKGLWGALVSVPGVLDERAGKVLLSPNLHWLENVDLAALVGQACKLPVLLVQEIRALALGQLAAAPLEDDFLLIDFGMGVGGAVVRRGELQSSPLPTGGEIGHTPVEGQSRPCGCGASGCLETLVSQRALLESFSQARRIANPKWQDFVRHVNRQGVEPWLAQPLRTAAKVFAGALNLLGLRRVVLTGFVTELPPEAVELMEAELRRHTLWARFGEVTCKSAPHYRAAGLILNGLDRLVLPQNFGKVKPPT